MAIAASALSLSSCMDQLDIPQKSVLSTDEYYANAGPKEAEQLIAGVYKNYYTGLKSDVRCLWLDILSDDCTAGGGNFADNASQLRNAANLIVSVDDTVPKGTYAYFYRIIYYCNLIIERVPDSDDPTIKRVKAEADFMRALALFEAVRWYGTPPFVTKVLTTEEERQMGNGDTKEMIVWCMERMQAAADILDPIPGIGQQFAYGARISKHGALAYKGKAGLWYGQKFNDKAILQEGMQALKTVINSGLYGLVEDMSIFNRPAGDFCKEYIFEHNSADNDGYPSNQSHMFHTYVNWRPENLYMPVGLESIGWGWAPPSGEFGDFLLEHEGGADKPRFKANILTYDQVLELEYPTENKGIYDPVADNSGYFRNKGLFYSEDVYQIGGFWKYSMVNMSYMRYAEVLLMYAEAKFLLDNDADGSGLAALNQVRVRAELEPLATMTYQDIKDERRAELWAQQERYFDLVRWGDAAKYLDNKGKVWYTFAGYKEGTTEWDIRTQEGQGAGWNDKYNLLPFPQPQLIANPNLKQNPGW